MSASRSAATSDALPREVPERAGHRRGGSGVLLALAWHRLAYARVDMLPLLVALAVAEALAGLSGIIGPLAADRAVQDRLALLPPERRSVIVESREAAGSASTAGDAAAALLTRLGHRVGRAVRTTIYDPVSPADERGVRIIETSPLAVAEGRAPAPCTAAPCEALAVDPGTRLGTVVRLAQDGHVATLRIVGRARLPGGDAGSRAIAVTDARPLAPVLENADATKRWSAPLQAPAIRARDLDNLGRTIRNGALAIRAADTTATVRAPLDTLAALRARIRVSGQQLLLVGLQAAALSLALVALIAAGRRAGRRQRDEQLLTLAASPRQARIVALLESMLTAGLAAVPALALVAAGGVLFARTIGGAGATVGSLAWRALVPVFAVAIAGAVAIAVVEHRPPRARALLGAGVACLAVLAWQLAATGGLDPDQIADHGTAGPLLALPALVCAFGATAVGAALPSVLRWSARRLPLRRPTLRLAVLHAARRPATTAAATGFLAVCIAAAAFGLTYAATLRTHARDAAYYATGGAVQVREAGGVEPLARYRAAGLGAGAPILRFAATAPDPLNPVDATDVALTGVPATAVDRLPGWRSDFASLAPQALGGRLAVRATGLRGPRLPARAREVVIDVRARTRTPRTLELTLLTRAGSFATLPLGAPGRSWSDRHAPVPPDMQGARVVGLAVPPVLDLPGLGTYDEGHVDFGPLRARTADATVTVDTWGDWSAPVAPGPRAELTDLPPSGAHPRVRLDVNGSSQPRIRSEQPDLGPLPAFVSPAVAAQAVHGRVALDVAGHAVPIRTVAAGSWFPGVPAGRPFAVVDEAALWTRLNLDDPGFARADEAWFTAPPPKEIGRRLATGTFRSTDVRSAAALERAERSDPLARGITYLLTILAVVAILLGFCGLAFAVLDGARGDRGALGELQALGLLPSQVRRSVRLQTLLITLIGTIAGLALALASARLVASIVTVSGTAQRPIPPIRLVVDPTGAIALLGVAVVAALAVAAWCGRRAVAPGAAGDVRA